MFPLIGLTGLYCSGKNHVASLLEKRGFPVLDVDKLGHEVLETKREALVRRFGSGILDPAGRIDRRLLGALVFGRPEVLAVLEGIVHPAVNDLTARWIDRQAGPCVINAALLHKSAAFSRLNAVLVVRAPLPVRFLRARKRDALPPAALIRRFSSQKDFPLQSRGAQLFPSAADIYIVENPGFPGSRRSLEKRIDAILEGLQNHGKEEITAYGGFGGSIPGRGDKRGAPGL
ncbi:MAG: dephospho-CoA kinase [Spirochaetaceae bacterium]|jgi:dephospho-CoA kinase|nr:dephospho-CoA kinase [Spirochaetaceae bacterium]